MSITRIRSQGEHRHAGHRHLGWAKLTATGLSRRRFIRATAGATGLLLSSGLWLPGLARAAPSSPSDPKPIPGGDFANAHFFLPAPGAEPATITDFDGFVGLAAVGGSGSGTDTRSGATTSLVFDGDMRFMQGTYIGVDGQRHSGAFTEI